MKHNGKEYRQLGKEEILQEGDLLEVGDGTYELTGQAGSYLAVAGRYYREVPEVDLFTQAVEVFKEVCDMEKNRLNAEGSALTAEISDLKERTRVLMDRREQIAERTRNVFDD